MKYLPILKGKKAEYDALKELSDDKRNDMCPLIEITDVPWNYESEEPAKTVDMHIQKLPEQIQSSWGTKHPIMFDFPASLYSAKLLDGRHVLTGVADSLGKVGIKPILVVGIDRPTEYVEAVKVSKNEYGICIRVGREDFQLPDLGIRIQAMVDDFGMKPEDVDVLLDFRDLLPGQESVAYLALRQALASLPNVVAWRNVIFAAASFPKTMAEIERDSQSRLPRTEWLVWKLIYDDRKEIARIPTYGDYTIAHPEMVEVDPRIMEMSAAIRYTSEEEWLVLKGRGVRKNGFGQFATLCKDLMELPDFKGRKFSSGDAYIEDCSKGKQSSGNATTWRKNGLSHHFAMVLYQLSNL